MGLARSAVVVGGGVIGVTSAYALARDGWRVHLLDQNREVAQEASLGNGRQLSYSHTNALASPGLLGQVPRLLLGCDAAFRMTLSGRSGYLEWLARFLANCTPAAHRRNTLEVLQLAQESHAAMDRLLASHPVEFARKRAGKLVVLHSEAEVEALRPMLAAKRAAGLDQSLLTHEEACAIEPALARSPDRLAGALHAPGDETGDCSAFSLGLLRIACEEFGVQFSGGSDVTALVRSRDKTEVVLADGTRLAADLAVVASGHAVNRLIAPLGHRLPIQPMKGYSFTAPSGNAAPLVSVTESKRRIVFTNLGDRMLVAGIAEMGRVDSAVDTRRLESMIAAAYAFLPEAAVYGEADAGWAGLRPITPNSQPIIGMLAPGIAVNGGQGMLGWTLAMGSAERLATAVAAH